MQPMRISMKSAPNILQVIFPWVGLRLLMHPLNYLSLMPMQKEAAAKSAIRPPPAPAPRRRESASMQNELREAVSICQQAKGAVISMFSEARLGRAVDAGEAQALVQDISDSVARNPGALISLARLKTADDYTYMHSVAVCALMVALARQLGLSATHPRQRTA